jgi:hypothetical protein
LLATVEIVLPLQTAVLVGQAFLVVVLVVVALR